MSLPIVPLDHDEIEIGGQMVEYHSLTRTEVTKLAGYGEDTDAAEAFMVACGTGVSVEEAAAWRASVSAPTVSKLLAAIGIISGLRTQRGKAGNP